MENMHGSNNQIYPKQFVILFRLFDIGLEPLANLFQHVFVGFQQLFDIFWHLNVVVFIICSIYLILFRIGFHQCLDLFLFFQGFSAVFQPIPILSNWVQSSVQSSLICIFPLVFRCCSTDFSILPWF